MAGNAQARTTGRPRDPRIEQAALSAVRELLVDGGYAAVTGAAVAQRAGTTKGALYRRWPALPHLIHEAAFPSDLALDLHLAEDLDTVLAGIVRGTRDALCSPAGAAALPGLLAEITTWPDLHAAMLERFSGAFAAIDERLRRAVADGEASPDVRAADLIQVVIGSIIAGVLLTPAQLDDRWAGRLTALLARAVRP